MTLDHEGWGLKGMENIPLLIAHCCLYQVEGIFNFQKDNKTNQDY